MRVIVVGLGVQGSKRLAIVGKQVVATVDPANDSADHRRVEDVSVDSYDAALVCTPDDTKVELLTYLLGNGKHVLVEKPLVAAENAEIEKLAALARDSSLVCYTAYNHRFEPHFVRMKEVIESGVLGEIYTVRLFYGNGTARLVRESPWRDRGTGVLRDLGAHLLDTILFWLGRPDAPFHVFSCNRFENQAFDHVSFGANGQPVLQLEATLLSWRNHFYADVLAEKGSAHIHSLCKWGPSTFTLRRRKFPSGPPDEELVPLVQPDPTWALEYEHFRRLCTEAPQNAVGGNIENDIWINTVLNQLARDALERAA